MLRFDNIGWFQLEELRELKADMDRKDAQTSAIIKRQAEQIEQLENLYREEQILRKKYFNMMEDMKGKIRVYCRTRPLSSKVMAQTRVGTYVGSASWRFCRCCVSSNGS